MNPEVHSLPMEIQTPPLGGSNDESKIGKLPREKVVQKRGGEVYEAGIRITGSLRKLKSLFKSDNFFQRRDYKAVINSDESNLEMAQALVRHGVVIMENVPTPALWYAFFS